MRYNGSVAIIKFTFTESDVPANAVKLREVPAEKWGQKVGIETASGQRHFTSINNVEVAQND